MLLFHLDSIKLTDVNSRRTSSLPIRLPEGKIRLQPISVGFSLMLPRKSWKANRLDCSFRWTDKLTGPKLRLKMLELNIEEFSIRRGSSNKRHGRRRSSECCDHFPLLMVPMTRQHPTIYVNRATGRNSPQPSAKYSAYHEIVQTFPARRRSLTNSLARFTSSSLASRSSIYQNISHVFEEFKFRVMILGETGGPSAKCTKWTSSSISQRSQAHESRACESRAYESSR